MFATLEAASRSAFLLRAEIEMHGVDTGLISSRGAWIQIGSEPGSGAGTVRGIPQIWAERTREGGNLAALLSEPDSSMHWTVLGLHRYNDTISLAHVGIPEDRAEGIAGIKAIATSLRFD
jgi:hypothetical protein